MLVAGFYCIPVTSIEFYACHLQSSLQPRLMLPNSCAFWWFYSPQCPLIKRSFHFWWWGHKLCLCVWSRECSGCFCLVVFSLPSILSSHAHADQYLVEDSTGPLCRFSRTLFVSIPSSSGFCPINYKFQPLWPTESLCFLNSKRLLSSPWDHSSSLCYALETHSRQGAWILIGPTSFVILLSWRILLCCLLFDVWKLLFHTFCLPV